MDSQSWNVILTWKSKKSLKRKLLNYYTECQHPHYIVYVLVLPQLLGKAKIWSLNYNNKTSYEIHQARTSILYILIYVLFKSMRLSRYGQDCILGFMCHESCFFTISCFKFKFKQSTTLFSVNLDSRTSRGIATGVQGVQPTPDDAHWGGL